MCLRCRHVGCRRGHPLAGRLGNRWAEIIAKLIVLDSLKNDGIGYLEQAPKRCCHLFRPLHRVAERRVADVSHVTRGLIPVNYPKIPVHVISHSLFHLIFHDWGIIVLDCPLDNPKKP